MHNRMDHWLLVAMAFAEALRGFIDLHRHLLWLRVKIVEAKERGDAAATRSWMRRSREWAAFAGASAVVCTIAIVPMLYYGMEARLG